MADIVDASDALRSAIEPGRLLGGPTVVPLDVVPFAMLVADASGAVRAVNQAWVEMSGLDVRSSRGTGWLAWVDQNDWEPVQAAIQRVVAGFDPARYHFRGADGRGATWRVVSIERAGEILVGIGVEPDPVAMAEVPDLSVTRPAPAAIPAEPATAVLRLVTEPADEDPLAPAVAGLFRSLDALLATIDRLAERLQLPPSALEPLPA
jgi:hypothetical protein